MMARPPLMSAVPASQVVRRGQYQFALLGCGDRVSRPGERAAATLPDLDEDELATVAHDQVDFTEAAVKVPLHERKATRLEEGEGARLGAPTYRSTADSGQFSTSSASISESASVGSAAGTSGSGSGTGSPDTNSAHGNSR